MTIANNLLLEPNLTLSQKYFKYAELAIRITEEIADHGVITTFIFTDNSKIILG